MNAQDTMKCFFAATTLDIKGRLRRYENGTLLEHFVTSPQAAGTTEMDLTPTKNGYYVIEFLCPTAPGFVLQVQGMSLYGNGNACFAHNMVQDLVTELYNVKTVRIVGQSLTYTNSSPVIDKGGKCAMFQLNGGEDWLDFAEGGYEKIASANGSGRMTTENGMYGFLKPSSASDFEMRSCAGFTQTGSLEIVYFDLDKPTQMLVFASEITQEDGRDAYFTFSTSLEFRTQNQWFEQLDSETNAELFEKSMALIRDLKQYHENPFHLSDLAQGAKSAIKKVLQYGPAILQLASKFA